MVEVGVSQAFAVKGNQTILDNVHFQSSLDRMRKIGEEKYKYKNQLLRVRFWRCFKKKFFLNFLREFKNI